MSVTEGILEPFSVGLGYADWIDVATPAAGLTASVTVEGGWFMRVISARLSLTTDATAANRLVTLDYINGRGVTYAQNGAAVVVSASTTAQVFEWDINRAVSEWAANTPVWAPLLEAIMPPSFTVKFNVTNVQATDQISGLHLWVEKFPTGPRGIPQGMVPAPGSLLPPQ